MTRYHGRFGWYELMTSDTAAALAFYRAVIGWDYQDAGMPGMDYGLLKAGDTAVAGLMAIPADACAAGAKPGWIGYVAVDDVDAVAAGFAADGGTVHRAPADIPGVGRFAIVSDPQGATLAIITEPESATAERLQPMKAGHGSWHELLAPDWDAALSFYAPRFGWGKVQAIDMGPMGTYQLYGPNDEAIGGMMTRPQGFSGPPWTYYFAVDEINAALDRVKVHGGTLLNGPQEVPGGAWIIQALDPQGAMFALVAPPAAA